MVRMSNTGSADSWYIVNYNVIKVLTCVNGSSVTVLADLFALFLHKSVMFALARMSQRCF